MTELNDHDASMTRTGLAADHARLVAEKEEAIALLRAIQHHANGRSSDEGGNYKRLFEINQWIREFLNVGAGNG